MHVRLVTFNNSEHLKTVVVVRQIIWIHKIEI